MPQEQQEVQEFLIETYKHLDRMKSQIKDRFEELEGREPSPEELQRQCWDVWRLTTFYAKASRQQRGEDDDAHAPYIPPEFVGERAERIEAMDARLQDVLGDILDVDDEEDDDEEDDNGDTADDFLACPEEQIVMVEYGSIMTEYRNFVDAFNAVQLSEGNDGSVRNIIQLHRDGFDAVMRLLWGALQESLQAQS